MAFKIKQSMIAKKAVVGSIDGEPVLYVLTKGGLHAFFSKKDGQLFTLSTAPHRAIGTFFAEQKAKDLDRVIKWNDSFLSKNENNVEDLIKAEDDKLFNSLRIKMFSGKAESHIPSPNYYIYDVKNRNIGMMSGKDVALGIANRSLPKDSVIRREDLSDDGPMHHTNHEDFSALHKSLQHYDKIKKWNPKDHAEFHNFHPSHAKSIKHHGIKEVSDGKWGHENE